MDNRQASITVRSQLGEQFTINFPTEYVSATDREVDAKREGDTSKYSLALGADETAAVMADCNRGAGSCISVSLGQLQFGRIAATRALYPPDSLQDRHLGHLPPLPPLLPVQPQHQVDRREGRP